MPRRVNPLDSWLRSGPGLFTAATETDAIENAHAQYADDGGKLDIDAFKAALKSAGRLPCDCGLDHSTGQYVYKLALPERQPDMARDRAAEHIDRSGKARTMKWTR